MSSSTVTIVVPTAENEIIFILNVVKAAIKAYLKTQNLRDQTRGQVADNILDRTTDEADKKTGTFGQPTSTIA